MAKYRVKSGMKGYINDRMESDGAVFEAKDSLTGSWFDLVADEPKAEVNAEAEPGAISTEQAQADAQEAAVAEPGDGTHTAETAAAELDAESDDGVETL